MDGEPWDHELAVLTNQYEWTVAIPEIYGIMKPRLYKLLMKFAELYQKYGRNEGFIQDAKALHDGLHKSLRTGTAAAVPAFVKLNCQKEN